MPRKSITLFAMLMATIVLFPGCKKEKTAELAATQVASGMLCFNSPEDFFETQQKVLAMSETERREWELQQGFESYATKCNELFEAFEAKGIESDEDIYNFVKENPDYFYIFIDEDGEEYLKSYLEDTYYNNLANENRMLRIGESIYKVFDEGIIRTSVEDQTNLLQVSSFYGSRHDGFSYYENHITDSQLDFCHEDGCNCNTIETIVRKTNGNNRTYTRFYISEETIVFNDPALMDYYYQMGIRYIYYYMKIRPYKRTLGVWYWCRRTIMYNMNYHVISTDNNAYYSNFTISGNEQGQESGGKVDKILHGYTGYTQSGRYKLLSGTTSTPDASCSVNCPNM